MSEELTAKSASELVNAIRRRQVSPVEVIEAHLRRIERLNPSINAVVTVAGNAIDRARIAEADIVAARDLGVLHGLPVTVKDTIDTQGMRTTSGSLLHARNVPATDATVVARLKAAGAIVIGKTNTSEMAIPYETDNPVFGRTNNPHNLKRTSGGSSGGEAAAIAAQLSSAGVGSDLSGSIRVPAHFCGIAGLKPTAGRVPMDGHLPLATGPLSLGACIGPMARRVVDLALLFRVMAGESPLEFSETEFAKEAQQRLSGVELAYYTDNGIVAVTEDTAKAIAAAAKALGNAGLQIREERPPGIPDGSRLWIELFAQAASEQIREFYRANEEKAGPRVAAILHQQSPEPTFENRIKTAEKLAQAVVERERRREELLRWMKTRPLILTAVGATPAFEHGAERVNIRGEAISVFRAFSYSQTFNVFGLPAVSVPVGMSSEGLPIGVQIVGRPFEEDAVLAAAAIVEQSFASAS